MQKSLATTSALLGALATVNATPAQVVKRDVIPAIPESADDLELRLQPYLDFDKDSCYNTAAIDPDGNTNPGHDATGTPEGDCRDPHQLENSNAYSRKRCNNGYCAVMYEYYFEKDQGVGGSFLGGHKDEWENVVVFSQGDDIVRVAASAHGGYDDTGDAVLSDDGHPMIVYHKDGGSTHCFRFASDDDAANPENYSGEFYRSPLLGWDSWPDEALRDKMLDNWSGGIGPKLDDEFGDMLAEAAGDALPDFDPYSDS